MKILLDPQDVLFFRDAVPMAAGVGKGAGCRLPLPNTLHEAVRSALLAGQAPGGKPTVVKKGRRGGWRGTSERRHAERAVASTAFSSLRTVGPFPWRSGLGVLFPMPLDVSVDGLGRARLLALLPAGRYASVADPARYTPPCLAAATTPPEKSPATGWWTAGQWQSFCNGRTDGLTPIVTGDLWQPEPRIGVEIDPVSQAAAQGQLYSATFLRPAGGAAFAAEAWFQQPDKDDPATLEELAILRLGGEARLVRLNRTNADWAFPSLPANPGGAQLVAWTLVTPAVFAHGWLPGWVCDTAPCRVPRPVGEVCLELESGRAWLAAVCAGKPLAFSGWDLADSAPKPTRLAVPAGSVYYFVAESAQTATELARLLHARPRSDAYGEKGFGYGLCRFIEGLHPAAPDGLAGLVGRLTKGPSQAVTQA